LTFDKVIIDAGRSFAAGQVYVALSRCRSLEGIVLHSLIPPTALFNDMRISEFSAAHHSTGELREVFAREQALYANYLLLRLFTFPELSAHMEEWEALITKKDIPDKEAARTLHSQIFSVICELGSVAEKFQRQLQRIIAAAGENPGYVAVLKERCEKAILYFSDQIASQIIRPLRAHINGLAYKKKVKRYLAVVQLMEESCWRKIDQLYQGRFMENDSTTGSRFTHGSSSGRWPVPRPPLKRRRGALSGHARPAPAGQGPGGDRGHPRADRRDHQIPHREVDRRGEINVYDVLPRDTVDAVMAFIEQGQGAGLGSVRSGLGNRHDFNDLRMIMSHALRQSNASRKTTNSE